MKLAREEPSYDVPNHLRNAPTSLAQSMGHGADYRYAEEAVSSVEQITACFDCTGITDQMSAVVTMVRCTSLLLIIPTVSTLRGCPNMLAGLHS